MGGIIDQYDVAYFTSVDAARRGNLIANHKIYQSVGHDEYRSGQKRANVQAARGQQLAWLFLVVTKDSGKHDGRTASMGVTLLIER